MLTREQVKAREEALPCFSKHTPTPDGYLARADWFEKMAKTHKQTRCPDCRLWAIWVPRKGKGSSEST